MNDGRFAWDEAKAKANLAKHLVSFDAAYLVFDDVFAVDQFDFVSDPGEIRCIITGLVNGVLLTVVYTERDDRVRIISARKASADEEAEYYRGQTPQ
ncbi:MAG TPA: BrnT family toxin [Bryobacteraceae bacterium]|jgi:hypothetical protein